MFLGRVIEIELLLNRNLPNPVRKDLPTCVRTLQTWQHPMKYSCDSVGTNGQIGFHMMPEKIDNLFIK